MSYFLSGSTCFVHIMLRRYSAWKTQAIASFIVFLIIGSAVAATSETATKSQAGSTDLTSFSAFDAIAQPKKDRHWALSLEAIALKRSSNSVSQPLVNSLAGNTTTFLETASAPGVEVFNSNQFEYGSGVGPKITLNYLDNSGYGLELSYFNVLNLKATKTIGPESSPNWYVMRAPGGFPPFWQTQDFPYQGMAWGSTTSLYSAEVNAKSQVSKSLGLLAGFRWIRLNDSLVGSLTPNDQNTPIWKKTGGCGPDPTLTEINNACNAGPPVGGYPPFWTTSTSNDLFGLQTGAEGTLFESGRFSVGGVLKAGVYNNRATQTGWVSMEKVMYSSSATTNRVAWVGDAMIQLKYLITNDLSIKVGYELHWLNKVALAPGQIAKTFTGQNLTGVTATGVNAGSNVLFKGGTVGLEYSF
jgi:hypothetical protein